MPYYQLSWKIRVSDWLAHFISLSIIVGNIWGLKRGEWKEASEESKRFMLYGIATLVFAVIVFAISNVAPVI